MTSMPIFAQRRENVRKALVNRKLDAFLVSLDANRYYLSGFELHDPQINESAGRLLICANGDDWLYTDARYLDAAKRLWPHDRIIIYTRKAPEEISAHAAGLHCQTIGFEANSTSVNFFERLERSVEWVQADGLIEDFRKLKDADEIMHLRRACSLNHTLMHALPTWLEQGVSEADLAWRIERFFRERGATELAFSSIVAYGANAALPHYIPSTTTTLAPEQGVLVDVGCRLDMYCSDQTRSFWAGEYPSAEFNRTLDAVRKAQESALACIRPGVIASDVYLSAWKYFDKLGLAQAFTHSLGHGIGLQTHEAPSLSAHNNTPLEAGMVVTVEPGLYYPQWGGIRWEYMVLVTEDGYEVL